MKKKISNVLILTIFMNLISVFSAILPVSTTIIVSAIETQAPTQTPRPVKILEIGNSFAQNCVRYISKLLKDCGETDVMVADIYHEGYGIQNHWASVVNNSATYTYYKDFNNNGVFVQGTNKTIEYALLDQDWDYIITQQKYDYSDEESTYNDDIVNLANYVKSKCPNAKLIWNMTWAALDIPDEPYFGDQESYYYSITNCVQDKILTNPLFERVLPVGTALQNARTSYIGNNFNGDSRHLNDLGCYVAGMTWLKALGWSIDDITVTPTSVVPAEYIDIVKESVNNTIAKPYRITLSSYTPTPDPNATPTLPPLITPTPGPDGKIIVPLLKDSFEKYNDSNDLISAGWKVTGTANPVVKSTALPLNHQSISIPAGGSISKTFYPIPVNLTGGKSPGKNAKLVISYDAYIGSTSGAASSYIKIDDEATGHIALAAGRRSVSSKIFYSKSVPSDLSSLMIINSMPKFTKLKFEVKITDENGEFSQCGKTKVDIYAVDMDTPIASCTDVNLIDDFTKTINRFYIGGQTGTEVDNLDINLIIDSDNMPTETLPPTPTQDPNVNKDALKNKLLEANNRYELANAHLGTGSSQFEPNLVSALYAQIVIAQGIYNNVNSTQVEVDNAVVNLGNSIAACVSFTPSPTPVPDASSLGVKIGEANTLYSIASANIGTEIGKYPSDKVQALYNEIQSAGIIYNNPLNYTQVQINAEVAKLQTAINNCVQIVPTTAPPSTTAAPTTAPSSSIIVDNTDSGCTFDATWPVTTYTPNYYGLNYANDGNTSVDPTKWAKWTPNITVAGTYNIYMWWTAGSNRPDAAPLEIKFDGDIDTTQTVNQQQNNATWVLIGTYDLTVGTDNYVKILASDSGATIADAVKFECISAITPTPPPTATPTPLPRYFLADKITLAQAKYDNIVNNGLIGANPGQYDSSLVSALYAAINHANDVIIDPETTSDGFYTEAANLQTAIDLCVPYPTLTPNPTPTLVPTETPTSIPTYIPTQTPIPTATPIGTPVEQILLQDNFNDYADINAVVSGGWNLSGMTSSPTPLPVLASTSAPANLKYVSLKNGALASKTFNPVQIKATANPPAGCIIPGKNAKIVIEFDGFMSGGSGGSTSYFRLDQSANVIVGSNTTVPTVVSVGRRAVRSSRWDYSTSIGSDSTSHIITSSAAKFTKIRAEVKITDSNGAFLSGGPKIAIYVNGQLSLAGLGAIRSEATFIDKFVVSGGSAVTSDYDNVSIKLISDDSYVPIQRTVNATVVAGTGTGTISPSGSFAVDDGDGKTFIIAPNSGMQIESIMINGATVSSSSYPQYYSVSTANPPAKYQYTLGNVTTHTTIAVKFYDPLVGTSTPTPTLVPVDKTALVAKIAEAEALYIAANGNVGTEPGQYDLTLVSSIFAAIEHAKGVRDNMNATQTEVDMEVITLQAVMGVVVTNTPSLTPTIEPTPTAVPSDYITSNDANVVVDQVNKKINYYHYKKDNINYFQISVMKSKVVASVGYTYDIYQSDETTVATGTNMEPMYKVVVSSNGAKVATYTFVATMLYGDIDGSGTIVGSDLIWLRKYIIKSAQYLLPKPYSMRAADINKSGGVNGSDLLLLRKYIISSTKYPITGATEFIYNPTV